MTVEPERKPEVDTKRVVHLPMWFVVELVIGLGLTGVLILVAWASSAAIRFVYGGY